MTYEAAPATTLLASHCAVCARPLLDAESVEAGIGPDCRKHGFAKASQEPDWSAVGRALAGADVAALVLPEGAEVAGALWALGGLETRRVANRLVARIAIARSRWASHDDDKASTVASCVTALRALGFVRLADVCASRLATVEVVERTDETIALRAPYSDSFLAASRKVPGRRWDGERKLTTFPRWAEKAALRAVALAYGADSLLATPEGLRTAEQAAESAPELAPPTQAAAPMQVARILVARDGKRLIVHAPYSASATEAWRAIPGRRWDAAAKANTLPVTALSALRGLIEAHYPGAQVDWPAS